ncbi:MAG: HDOD domain-containing protein [Acidobacteriia bacterium]|nr:HDOD domain-containing protein [Terriglobia bacterium]
MISEQLEKFRPRINALDSIPTIPVIIQPLLTMLQLPPEQVDLEKVAELVSYDKTIAVQCLRMANSPLFGRRQVETVRNAVMILGMKRVQSILLCCSLNQVVPADKWAFDPLTFWRHSLGCALVTRKMAQMIGYPDAEKAYLAGLLHDLGILVNSLVCTEEYRKCVEDAAARRISIDRAEQEWLGFTHCQSGKVLAERWNLSTDLIEVIEFHHDVELTKNARPLVAMVHLSDLLCRVRELGYGYYEVMGLDLAGDVAWSSLVQHYPTLASVDLARFTLDIEGAIDEIAELVDSVFSVKR